MSETSPSRSASPSPLRYLTGVETVADVVRWACVLEATAPKPGNVHPTRSFADLSYGDFVHAAEATAEILTATDSAIGKRIAEAVRQSCRNDENVNLGIVLLLAPMIGPAQTGSLSTDSIRNEIASWTSEDSRQIFATIATTAGNLGDVDAMDVRDAREMRDPPSLIAAMTAAAARDRVARQYADGFEDLFKHVVPLLDHHLRRCGDTLGGIVAAAADLLTQEPDSLIARKHGDREAENIQQRIKNIDREDPGQLADVDRFLRDSSPRYNPGTTADLMAAALFVLIHQQHRNQIRDHI